MKCQQLIDDVRKDLNDPREVTWSQEDLERALANALLALAVVRPDATAVTASIPLVAGSKQSLPAGGLRLIKAVRNMGADGSTPGSAIRIGDRETLDATYPDWHQELGLVVYDVIYDPLSPKDFYTYPAMSAAGMQIEASYSRVPPAISNPEADDLPVDDIYAPALHARMLSILWGGDDDSSPNLARAQSCNTEFFQLLGVKSSVDRGVSAKPGSTQQ